MKSSFTRPAIRITVIYVVVASLWILFSDRWVTAAFEDAELRQTAQTLKGWLFVAFTGTLLFCLMKRTLNHIRVAAFEDPLCGLPNRQAFVAELRHRCQRGVARHQIFSLTILDVDHFSDLNDAQGHAQGDLVLNLLSKQLISRLSDDWYIARLGGDEFALLSPVNAGAAEVLGTLGKLQYEVARRSEQPLLEEQRISAGTSTFPAHGRNTHDLLRHADMALSWAKEQGRDRHVVYHEQLENNLIERVSLLKDLKTACDNEDFDLVYQPQWSVANQCWAGVEVLIRWHHSTRGAISPMTFIPLAERAGIIAPITEFVVKRALSELKASGIYRQTLPCLSINLSHPVLLNHKTMDRLFNFIQKEGDSCPHIVMEITETAAMEDLEATLESMQKWQHENIRFSIDDFGTGYSSLARLKQMPITELKIDRSFIREIPSDQNDIVITKAILAIAQTLSLDVVAEGVETQEQMDFLTEHGCNILQGYHLARPMPIDKLKELLCR